jgi:aminopeptidase N
VWPGALLKFSVYTSHRAADTIYQSKPPRGPQLSDNPFRLPRHVTPSHYAIRLDLDFEKLNFKGDVSIEIGVSRTTDEIVLNAADLEIESVELGPGGARVTGVSFDGEYEMMTVSLDTPIRPGSYSLDISYRGTINDQLKGLYQSVYRDPDGEEHLIATSQCQSTDARRILPCWDEPDFKATFQTTMIVPAGLEAFSNTRELERVDLGNGRVEFQFAPTMKMSSYLLAFVAGPFEATEPREVLGTPMRIIVPKGNLHLTDVAMENAIFCFEYLSDYYGIPYPGDKLDHIAIPDFAAGAMENVGLITYRDAYLIIDEEKASHAELQASLDVIGHEIAHQWFGNLVTLAWWEGAWLNEAFASFMELKATDTKKPEWKRWLAFGNLEVAGAMTTDQLTTTRPIEFEVNAPDEVDEMFDAITYGKGSAVLRMIEMFIEEDRFRIGVGNYLSKHQYGNTVTPDLWEALDGVCVWPVSEIMDTWIYQRGFPQIDVARTRDGLMLSQRRYLATPDESDTTIWSVPLQLRGSVNGEHFQRKVLLDNDDDTIRLEGKLDWVVANAGGHGFYRTSYADDLFEDLFSNLTELDAIERYSLVSDTLAFVQNGQVPAANFLDLVGRFQDEEEHAVWSVIVSGLGLIEHHALDETVRARFEEFVVELLRPAFDRLGWEPEAGEPDLQRKLRGMLIGALGNLGQDESVIAVAGQIAGDLISGDAQHDPEVANASLAVFARHGSKTEYDALWMAYEGARTPLDRRKYLRSVAAVEKLELAAQTLERIMNQDIRTQDGYWVLAELLGGKAGPGVWEKARKEWDRVLNVMPGFTKKYVVAGIPALSQPEVAVDVRAFFSENPMPDIKMALAQRLERLDSNVTLRERETARIKAYFE